MAVEELLSLYELNKKRETFIEQYNAMNEAYNDLTDAYEAIKDMAELVKDSVSNALTNSDISSSSLDSNQLATANVTIEDITNIVKFELGIPKGDTGAAGSDGEDGTNLVFRIVSEEPDVEDMTEGEIVVVVSSSTPENEEGLISGSDQL